MVEAELLKSIATQLMTGTSVSADGKSVPVRRTSSQRLKSAAFSDSSLLRAPMGLGPDCLIKP